MFAERFGAAERRWRRSPPRHRRSATSS